MASITEFRSQGMFCDQNMNRFHESGEWELKQTHLIYKLFIRRCKYCGKVMNEKVQGRREQ